MKGRKSKKSRIEERKWREKKMTTKSVEI